MVEKTLIKGDFTCPCGSDVHMYTLPIKEGQEPQGVRFKTAKGYDLNFTFTAECTNENCPFIISVMAVQGVVVPIIVFIQPLLSKEGNVYELPDLDALMQEKKG